MKTNTPRSITMQTQRSPRILLIDDDRRAHERFHDMTGDLYELHSAYDGEEGLLRASQCQPDLIMLDVMMPGTDGLTVCGNLRAHPALCDIPIIMLTALDDQETRLASLREGADEFLTKPFNDLEMKLRLRNMLEINRYRRIEDERARTQWLLDGSKEACLMLDDQLSIKYANTRARALLGLPEDMNSEEPLNFQLALGEFHTEPRKHWSEWLAQPRSSDAGLLHLLRPASNSRPNLALQMQTHVHYHRSRASILVRLTDVTAETNSQLMRWTFQYHVAHKLFTPLTAIKGGLEILEETAAARLDKSELEAFEAAMKSTNRLLSDCRKVVDYLELGHAAPLAGRFPVSDMGKLCTQVWSAAGIRLGICDLDAKLERSDLAISELTLTAIIAELSANSRKFSHGGVPQITLRVESTSKQTAILSFTDAGMQIQPEQLAHVWLPHYQAEKSLTGAVPGMGMGLASVALQVWQVGGACAFKNNEHGGGVTVSLEIPLAKPEPPGNLQP